MPCICEIIYLKCYDIDIARNHRVNCAQQINDIIFFFLGGLAEEVDEKVLHAAFIPFGEIVDVQIPLDYESEKHRGFAFIEFEMAEDAAAAIDNMVYL